MSNILGQGGTPGFPGHDWRDVAALQGLEQEGNLGALPCPIAAFKTEKFPSQGDPEPQAVPASIAVFSDGTIVFSKCL